MVLLFWWAGRRDWRAGAILAGVAAGYLPWFMYPDRTMFYFYAVSFEPFLVLALVYCLGLVLGRAVRSAVAPPLGAVPGGPVRGGSDHAVGLLLPRVGSGGHPLRRMEGPHVDAVMDLGQDGIRPQWTPLPRPGCGTETCCERSKH